MDRHGKVALDLVETLYVSAVDESGWSGFLRGLATASRAIIPGLHLLRQGTNEPLLVVEPNLELSWRRAFENYYVRHDIRRPHIRALPEGAVFLGQEVLPDAELERSEFYNDFLRPQGLFHIAGGMFLKDEQQIGVVRVLRSHGAQPFGKAELRLLRLLLPHLKRAIAIRDYHLAAQVERDTRDAILDSLVIGVLLLDEDGRVVWTNRSADRLLEAKDGLALAPDGLVASGRTETLTLRRLIADAARADGLTLRGGPISISRGPGRKPLSLLVVPLSRAGISAPGIRATVVVFATNPEASVQPAEELVQTFLGITPAEARLAVMLTRGLSVAELTDELGITELTARTHLHRLYTKTKTTGQTDLVRLVLSTPAGQILSAADRPRQKRMRDSQTASSPGNNRG